MRFPQLFERAVVRLLPAALALSTILAAGCTTVPTKEFATYKETFTMARAAGEDVILDYGATVTHVEDLKAKRAAAKAMPKKRGERFDPAAVGKNAATVDHVLIRMKAWDVVARYNDLLTALAEGRAADELAGAVDGLSSSLGSFPIAAVAASWADVSGYLAPLKPLALEAVRERSRRDFIAAVAKGAPLITDKFLKLLKDDARDFYALKSGLNDLELAPSQDSANETGRRIVALAGGFQASPEVDDWLNQLNTDMGRLPVDSNAKPLVFPLKIAKHGAGTLTPEARAQIGSLAGEMKAQMSKMLAKDAELEAYRELLSAYVGLLNQLERSMRALQVAAEQAQPGIPQAADLERTVILLRQAYIVYKDKSKE
jgi:hypothetical protein